MSRKSGQDQSATSTTDTNAQARISRKLSLARQHSFTETDQCKDGNLLIVTKPLSHCIDLNPPAAELSLCFLQLAQAYEKCPSSKDTPGSIKTAYESALGAAAKSADAQTLPEVLFSYASFLQKLGAQTGDVQTLCASLFNIARASRILCDNRTIVSRDRTVPIYVANDTLRKLMHSLRSAQGDDASALIDGEPDSARASSGFASADLAALRLCRASAADALTIQWYLRFVDEMNVESADMLSYVYRKCEAKGDL